MLRHKSDFLLEKKLKTDVRALEGRELSFKLDCESVTPLGQNMPFPHMHVKILSPAVLIYGSLCTTITPILIITIYNKEQSKS